MYVDDTVMWHHDADWCDHDMTVTATRHRLTSMLVSIITASPRQPETGTRPNHHSAASIIYYEVVDTQQPTAQLLQALHTGHM